MLQQEPPLTEGKTVLENVEEAVAELKGKMKRLEEAYMEMGEPDADQDALMEETGNLQTELDNANAWDLDSRLDQAMDALRCPPPDVLVDNLSGGERRRVALCKLLLAAARPAAPRRAHQPPRRRVGPVARGPPRRATPAPSWP